MDKLYWIVCEENDRTLYEGRFTGRTRGAALKHLKEQLGRSNLTGLVFAITEIPVPLIREIVAELLEARMGNAPSPAAPLSRKSAQPLAQIPSAIPQAEKTEPSQTDDANPFQGATPRSQYPWDKIKTCYMQGRSPKDVALRMNVPINTLRGRIKREGWAQQRRQAA